MFRKNVFGVLRALCDNKSNVRLSGRERASVGFMHTAQLIVDGDLDTDLPFTELMMEKLFFLWYCV